MMLARKTFLIGKCASALSALAVVLSSAGCANVKQSDAMDSVDVVAPIDSTDADVNAKRRLGVGHDKRPSTPFEKQLKNSVGVISIDAQGNFYFFGPDGQRAEPCTEEQGPNQCAVFQRPVEVLSMQGVQVLQYKGSHHIYITFNGQRVQICLDKPGGKPIPCDSKR